MAITKEVLGEVITVIGIEQAAAKGYFHSIKPLDTSVPTTFLSKIEGMPPGSNSDVTVFPFAISQIVPAPTEHVFKIVLEHPHNQSTLAPVFEFMTAWENYATPPWKVRYYVRESTPVKTTVECKLISIVKFNEPEPALPTIPFTVAALGWGLSV